MSSPPDANTHNMVAFGTNPKMGGRIGANIHAGPYTGPKA